MLNLNSINTSKFIVGGLLLMCISHASNLQADHVNKRDILYFQEPPSIEQLAQQLFPQRTRSFILPEQSGSAAQPKQSVGMPVLFHFGKVTLVESTKPFLDKVGELMQQSEYSRETLIIEGHTDAVGTEQRNHKLSQLRALAVKDYLVKHYNIDPMRLFPEGKGESRLFDAENPLAEVNRRVEFLRF